MEKLNIGTLIDVKKILEKKFFNFKEDSFDGSIDKRTVDMIKNHKETFNLFRIFYHKNSPYSFGIITGHGCRYEGLYASGGSVADEYFGENYEQAYLMPKISRFVYKIKFHSRGKEFITLPEYVNPFVSLDQNGFIKNVMDKQIDSGGWRQLYWRDPIEYKKMTEELRGYAYDMKCPTCGRFVAYNKKCSKCNK